jgi:hypothetical protein
MPAPEVPEMTVEDYLRLSGRGITAVMADNHRRRVRDSDPRDVQGRRWYPESALREVDKDAREAGQAVGQAKSRAASGISNPTSNPKPFRAKAELEKFRREEERKAIRQKHRVR